MKTTARLLLLLMLICGTACVAAIKNITIVQTSDLHGQFTPASIERLGSIIQQEVTRGGGRDNAILLDSGDLIQGSFAAAAGKGKTAIEVLNHLKFDLWTPGNHDFDFGFAVLSDRIRQFKGQTIMANVEISGTYPIKPYILIRRNGLKIAVIGLTFPNLWRDYLPGEPEFKLQNFSTTLDRIMPQVMKEKPDIIILSVHYGVSMSYGGDKNNSLLDIAHKYPQINYICGGHTHQVSDGKDIGYGVWYTEPGKHGQGVIAATLSYDTEAGRVTATTSKFITEPDNKKFTCPTELRAELEQYQAQEKVIIGQAAEPISGSVRGVNSPLQNLFAQAVCAAVGADFALIAPSREQITLQGNITEKVLFELTPYDDTISVITVTPAQLKDITAEQLGWKVIPQRQLPWGFHVNTDAKGKITDLRIPGNPSRCKIAVSSFIITRGKNWYPQLQKLALQPENHLTDTNITLRDALRRYIKAKSPLQPDYTKWLINP